MARFVGASLHETVARGCALAVLTCGDWRLQARMREFLEKHYGEGVTYDLLAVPGGPFGFLHGTQPERVILLDYMRTFVDKHHPETLVVIPHRDCAMYNGRWSFVDEVDEFARLLYDVDEVQAVLAHIFPNLEVLAHVAEVRGTDFLGFQPTSHSRPPIAQTATVE